MIRNYNSGGAPRPLPNVSWKKHLLHCLFRANIMNNHAASPFCIQVAITEWGNITRLGYSDSPFFPLSPSCLLVQIQRKIIEPFKDDKVKLTVSLQLHFWSERGTVLIIISLPTPSNEPKSLPFVVLPSKSFILRSINQPANSSASRLCNCRS